MSPKGAYRLFLAAVAGAILQAIGLLRFVERLPEDWVGIALYVVSGLVFALAAFGFYAQWRQGTG